MKVECCPRPAPHHLGGGAMAAVLVIALAAIAVYVIGVVLMGVFSWHGLAYSLFLSGAGPLRFALAVRVVTLTALTEFAVLIGMFLDHRDGRRYLEFRWAWIVAHATLMRRVARRSVWLALWVMTIACDCWHHRPVHLVPSWLTFREFAAVAANRWADLRYGLLALFTRAGRARWRRYSRVVPTRALYPGDHVTGTVIDGSIDDVVVLRTWRAESPDAHVTVPEDIAV